MKSFHERYFEDYKEGGIYIGTWYQWGEEGREEGCTRKEILILESIESIAYLASAFQYISINTNSFVSIFGIFSLLAWFIELYGLFGQIRYKKFYTEFDYKVIEKCARVGTFIHGLLLSMLDVAAIGVLLTDGISLKGFLTIAGYIIATISCFSLYLKNKNLCCWAFESINGKPGKRI